MLTRVHSVTTAGLEPIAVDVEITTTSGIPQIFLIGMVNTAIKEAKDRIITALKVLGIKLKARKTIISLTPADLKKSGSSFDLAIAVALLSIYNKIRLPLDQIAFIGEISLDGSVTAVTNCFALIVAAKKLGYTAVIISHHNLKDASLITGIDIYGIKNLKEIIDKSFLHLKKFSQIPLVEPPPSNIVITGQTEVVRALTIAIAGNHHIHLVGPPGVGKSTLPLFANALQPPLTSNQAVEVSSIFSLSALKRDGTLMPPFRMPHHSSTFKKIIGYESTLKPGEASLAHQGILFLDELSLFSTNVLHALRSLLDKKKVSLQSQQHQTTLPAKFILIAASNPCPCGFWQTGIKNCTCSTTARNNYVRKLTWPLLERFDLQVFVSSLQQDEYDRNSPKYTSAEIKERVIKARNIQKKRYKSTLYNSYLKLNTIYEFCRLESQTVEFLKKAVATYNLSTRGYEKIIAVSQTIADLEESPVITPQHCAEALQYRPAPL